jgi:hypothetical protein
MRNYLTQHRAKKAKASKAAGEFAGGNNLKKVNLAPALQLIRSHF